jgi:hypothetical protein
VDPVTHDALNAAEEAVRWLVARCRRGGRLHRRDPRAVSRVRRTGKGHLGAIASLRQLLEAAGGEEAGAWDDGRGA